MTVRIIKKYLYKHKMRFWKLYFVNFLFTIVKCDPKENIKSKNSLSYFRRKVEEQSEERSIESRDSDDSKTNLVSFLVNNVKEIFSDIDDVTEMYKFSATTSTVPPEIVTQTNILIIKTTEEDPKLTDYVMVYENISQSTQTNHKFYDTVSPSYEKRITTQEALFLRSKDKKSLEKTEETLSDNTAFSINSLVYESTELPDAHESGRSCIFCNNVVSEECNNPRNKLITSVVCESVDDLCYSQHTPFGIVDRGCFNLNNNLTTFVCTCNLCNHLSISQMPHFFSNKLDWVDNVVELSRARNIRQSVFKDMACLRCEANPKKKTHFVDASHCLEGNIGSLPTQICEENEVCAVKAIKGERYIWRGCVKAPLYNYWWSVCDSDLCNYDSLISIYDFV